MATPAIILKELGRDFPRAGTTVAALDAINAELPADTIIGLVGPDAAGKTTLMRILAGLMEPSRGEALLFGSQAMAPGGGSLDFVGYMPQKFGLYEDLSVMDNLRLHARLRNLDGSVMAQRFEQLLEFTALRNFSSRLAGRLSGGMKQKLGLACALIGTPRILLLDEPGVGVDPQSRRELWKMVNELAGQGMSVVWSTAYMDEAARCSTVLMLDEGRLIYCGAPDAFTARVQGRTFLYSPQHADQDNTSIKQDLLKWSQNSDCLDVQAQGQSLRLLFRAESAAHGVELTPTPARLEDAYMDAVKGMDHAASPFLQYPDLWLGIENKDAAVIEAHGLTKKFAAFVAADSISFSVPAGQIFGLLGPNGAGKSTTFRMLCGLSQPSSGTCSVAGLNLLKAPGKARARLGYMAQKFSLYGDLSVKQNISLFGKLYNMNSALMVQRRDMLVEAMGLAPYYQSQAQDLPLGHKQRLALLCAALHGPEALFLDEPTSGVDPRTRREFWKHINTLTSIGVAVLVTTHFMEEAEYCDKLALIYQGKMIAAGTPDSLKKSYSSPQTPAPSLEDAFIACIEQYHREHTT